VRFAVVVNGASAVALLDSGATNTVIDRKFACELGLQLRRGFRSRTLSRTVSGAYAERVEIGAGGRTFRLTAAVLDLSAIASASREPVDIILGQDVFRRSIIDIDFSQSQLRFADPEPRDLEDDLGPGVPLISSPDGFLAIPLSLEGAAPVAGAIDLGSNVPLYVSPSHASAAGLLRRKRVATSASAGVEGIAVSELATLSSITVANTMLHRVPVQVPRQWKPICPAVIGLPALRRFRIVLDCERYRVWLVPDPSSLELPFNKDRSGLGALPARDRLRVVHVSAGSPAHEAGIKAGDEIIAINGRRIDEDYLRGGSREGNRPAGTVLKIQLADGFERKLVLADYF
jgi:hypothetical protein